MRIRQGVRHSGGLFSLLLHLEINIVKSRYDINCKSP